MHQESMGMDGYGINSDGKREQLKKFGTGHGVRRDQISEGQKKLFDIFDVNGDGTLESEEYERIEQILSNASGRDKILSEEESAQISIILQNYQESKLPNPPVGYQQREMTLFGDRTPIPNQLTVDFLGFVKEVSDASQEIESQTKKTIYAYRDESGRHPSEHVITTTYKDGTKEIIYYYADGSYKRKELIYKPKETTVYVSPDGQTMEVNVFDAHLKAEYERAKTEYKKRLNAPKTSDRISINLPISPGRTYAEYKKNYIQMNNIRKETRELAEVVETYNSPRYANEMYQKEGREIASALYKSARAHAGAVGEADFIAALNKLSPQNVIHVIREYDKLSPEESLIEMIYDEWSSTDGEMKSALMGNQEEGITGIYSTLLQRAKEAGVAPSVIKSFKKKFREQMDSDLGGLDSQFKIDPKNLEGILYGMVQTIENADIRRNVSEILHGISQKEQEDEAIEAIETYLKDAKASFERQLENDGIFGEAADGISKIWGSKNTATKVRADIAVLEKQIADLKEAQKNGKFAEKFEEIFKTPYDAVNVRIFSVLSQAYKIANESLSTQNYVNNKLSHLLKEKDLQEEKITYSSDLLGVKPIKETRVSATREDVYVREYKKFAELLTQMGRDPEKELAGLLITDQGRSLEEKYAQLREKAQQIKQEVDDWTEERLGGERIEDIERRYNASYKAAFGLDNDILKRVTEYNISQQKGAGFLKGIVTLGAVIIVGVATQGTGVPGVLSVLAGGGAATAATFTTESLDAITKKGARDALVNEGIGAYLKKCDELNDWRGIAVASLQSGALMIAMGGATFALSNVARVTMGEFAKTVGGAYTMAGVGQLSGVLAGLGAEYAMTGEITFEGATYVVVLAMVSGALHVLDIQKKVKIAKAEAEAKAKGIPTDAEIKDARKLLGLKKGEELTADNLKKAYRKAALKYHSDKNTSANADEMMIKINEANEILERVLAAKASTGTPAAETTSTTGNSEQKLLPPVGGANKGEPAVEQPLNTVIEGINAELNALQNLEVGRNELPAVYRDMYKSSLVKAKYIAESMTGGELTPAIAVKAGELVRDITTLAGVAKGRTAEQLSWIAEGLTTRIETYGELTKTNPLAEVTPERVSLKVAGDVPRPETEQVEVPTNSRTIEEEVPEWAQRKTPSVGDFIPTEYQLKDFEMRKEYLPDIYKKARDEKEVKLDPIIRDVTEENIDLVEQLCRDKRYSCCDIHCIMANCTKENSAILQKICADGKFYEIHLISKIADLLTKGNHAVKLFEAIYENKNYPINYDNILYALGDVTPENVNFKIKLLSDKTIPKTKLPVFMEFATEENYDFIKKVLNKITGFNLGEWKQALSHVNKKTLPVFEQMLSKYPDISGDFLKWINDDNIKFVDFLLNNIENTTSNEVKQNLIKKLDSCSRFLYYMNNKRSTDFAIKLFEKTGINANNRNENLSIIKDYYNFPEMYDKLIADPNVSNDRLLEIAVSKKIEPEIMESLPADFGKMYNQCMKDPQKYVNGEFSREAALDKVSRFFRSNAAEIKKLTELGDRELYDNLMRRRLEDFKEYLDAFAKFKPEDIQLVKGLINSVNIDGKPFMPTQKAEFIDLIKAYKDNNLSTEKIANMIENGKVDLGELQMDLFRGIMKNSGLSDAEIASIPPERLTAWDTKYAHLLAKEIADEGDAAFADILRAGNLESDFNTYIHNENNVYGKSNCVTRTQFEQSGLDYEKWVHPSQEHEIRFAAVDENTQRVNQIAGQFIEDIDALRATPVKGFIDKQFPSYIKDGKFVIPKDIAENPAKLQEFITNITKAMEPVWNRAKGNESNPDAKRAAAARNTLTILDHFNQRVDDLSQIGKTETSKSIDVTVKMWDRNPQKDIFQGNYSTCCIGMGNGNGSAMPHYVMNTAYNMIELVDNQSGKTIGNALCYFVKGENGEPIFIIDNIEINNGSKPSPEIGAQLRDAIACYAEKVAKDVTGWDNVEVCMSKQYNDVPCNDLPSGERKISFVGDVDCDNIYMDLYEGWVGKDRFNSKQTLLKLDTSKEFEPANRPKAEQTTVQPEVKPESVAPVKVKVEAKPETKSIEEKGSVETPVENNDPFSFLNLSENPTAEEVNAVKENWVKLVNYHSAKGSSTSRESAIEKIQSITDVNVLKNITEIYKFMQEQGIEIDFGDYTGQIFDSAIVHNNFEGFKEVFNYLKENSQYKTENIVGIALHAKPESVQSIKDLYSFFAAKQPGFEKTFLSECQFEDLTPEVVKAKQDIYNLVENNIPKGNILDLFLGLKQDNLDIFDKIITEYKKGTIKNEHLSSLVGHLTNYSGKRTKEFVEENFDLLMKYQKEAMRILPDNIDLVKAAAVRNLPVTDVSRLIETTENYGFMEFVTEQVKHGVSIEDICKLVFDKTLSEKISQPLPYEPSLAYTLDPRNTGMRANSIKPLLPFEGLDPKVKIPERTIPVPSVEDLLFMLEQGQTVRVEIPNEGGAKPVQGYSQVHPEDRVKLGEKEEAGYEIRYGEKRGWSDSKIARDVMQNFYDGHGYTMEGVAVEVVKVGDKYKVKVTGDGTYDYQLLEETGASDKPDYTQSGGHYGEGAKVAAVSLLNKNGIDYVQYGCGEWVKTFTKDYDKNLHKDYMVETLTESKTPVKGNYFEFTTDDINLVHQMLEAKDYFKHPFNSDFQNMDFENEFFAIKILPEGQKGNLYVVQRYETGTGIENSVDGFTIVFKTKPENPELMQKSSIHHSLDNDRDRSAISNTQLENLLTMYGTTMSREDLAKLIVSMEPIWSKPQRTPQENAILRGILSAAEDRVLDVDFMSKKYVYIDERASLEDIEMAHRMGYKTVNIEELKVVGLQSVYEVTSGKKAPITPSSAQSQQIRLLDEGVRIIQSCCPEFSGLLRSDEVDAPKFIFNEGGSPNERAEAIVDFYSYGVGTYKGHWIKESALHTDKYVDLLATWIHEMSHKHGEDTSTEFTNALKKIETVILKTLTENPDALTKIKVLAEQYAKISGLAVKEAALNEEMSRYLDFKRTETSEVDFDSQAYIRQIQSEIQTLKEYKEYVSNHPPVKITLPEEWAPRVKYESLAPNPKTSETTLDLVPTTEKSMQQLAQTGSVRVSIPNIGGAKPTNSEKPVIHSQDVPLLGQTRPAKIAIRYGEQINWSNFKIARDIMQNFYNGNGFTMEGVTVNIEKVNGEYKIRINGLGKYDYKHLERLGSSTSDDDIGRSAGNYGEGTRIVAANLLARGYGNIKFGCGEWTMEFSKAGGRMMKTLTRNNEFLNGNYLELSTTDEAFVQELLKAKDYFNHPFNKEFQNMDFENEFFGFKRVEDDAEGQVFLVQKYEKNPDFKPSQHKLNIVFKRMPNDPELVSRTGRTYALQTGCDRVGLTKSDIQGLTLRYARTMSNEELIQSIATLEDFWTVTDPKDPMIIRSYETGSIEQTFARGLLSALGQRNLEIDFGDKKVVAISGNTPSDVIQYFQEKGYRFTTFEVANALGLPQAQDLYAQEHVLHSIRPTDTEAKQLQLINKALEIFAENDNYGLFSKNSETPIYIFDAKESNCSEIHAQVENREVKGLFIDRNILTKKDFLEIVQESLAQKLHTEGNDISANYSYSLTDLMRSEFDAFIKNPTVAQRLRILKQMYDELKK